MRTMRTIGLALLYVSMAMGVALSGAALGETPAPEITFTGEGQTLRVKVANPVPNLKSWRLELGQPEPKSCTWQATATGASHYHLVYRSWRQGPLPVPVNPDGVTWSIADCESGEYNLGAVMEDEAGKTTSVSQPVLIDTKGRLVPNVKMALYPDVVKGTAAIISLTTPDRLDKWSLALTAAGSDKVLAQQEGKLPFDANKYQPLAMPRNLFGDHVLTLTLTGGGESYSIRREFLPEQNWVSVGNQLRYAYFPSHNMIRFLVSSPPEDLTSWHAVVRADHRTNPSKSKKVLAERSGKLPMSENGENLPVPELSEGIYSLEITLRGGIEPVRMTRSVEVRHYEWENLNLGTDDVVVPPFTPLVADKKTGTVTAVLRTHTMNTSGLWEQVVSENHPLLAAPVRLEATSAGKTAVAGGKRLQFKTIKPAKVAGEARWAAGPLSGRTEFDYDIDGMMLLTLRLSKTKEPIERLQLVVPLKESEAWLMHPVTDHLRKHYAGRVPAGEGKVWDSKGIARDPLPGPLVPYVYVGGPARGICYAADNDRDWIIDSGEPAIEIDRAGGVVNLRLNLIAHPARLDRERTITFALQATPAKPMPDEPVTWRLWSWNAPENVKTVSPHLIGMNTYWGGRYPALDIFPAFYDFGIWDKMAESRRTLKFPQEYFDQWMARFPKDERAQLEGAMHEGMRVASCMPFSTPQTTKYGFLIPYTNPRGVALNDDAFRITYQDEWQTIDIVDPAWGKQGGGDIRSTREFGKAPMYAVEMVPSRVDEILYYHKKMYETFADGIYWDNFYLKACYTPEEAGGPAWVDDAGRLRPGVNLMGLRSLAKRNAVLMHVLGKRPLEFIHMTNANIVPMLSFGTINLEWEWPGAPGARGGDPRAHDLHERLGPNDEAALALILAESLGLQSGSISSAIDLIHNNSQTYAWQHRTAMAVCLPHEIKCGGTKELAFVHVQMAEFGYGQPGCKVYRYWEENYPLKTEGANVRALVLSNGPKAMLAIGDFGEGGEAALKLDLKALGLPEAARAYDVEKNRQEVRQTGPGAFVLPIKRHDFALVVVE